MSDSFSKRIQSVQPSATFAISAQAKALKAQGVDVINLSVGEPDFPTPAHICDAAIAAIKDGHTKYPQIDGIPELKSAIINKFKHENNLDYDATQLLVTTGAKQALYSACQALLNPGDEAIIPAPYWVSYPAQVLLAEGIPVSIETKAAQHYKITPEQLENAITPKTRLVFLNSPSNPSGMCYSKNELEALGNVLLKHPNVYILSDDIYEHIRWDDTPFINIANACPALKDRVIVINGVSKAYAMTGWRIGYSAASTALTAAMKKTQSHSTSGACSIAQYAATAALTGDQSGIEVMRQAYKRRHDLVLKALNAIDGVHCIPTDGSFYLFPDMSELMQAKGIADDVTLCSALINEAHVAPVPGSAFGTPGRVRFSTATSDNILEEAMRRLANFAK
jgi:aspartate aminotransferase